MGDALLAAAGARALPRIAAGGLGFIDMGPGLQAVSGAVGLLPTALLPYVGRWRATSACVTSACTSFVPGMGGSGAGDHDRWT